MSYSAYGEGKRGTRFKLKKEHLLFLGVGSEEKRFHSRVFKIEKVSFERGNLLVCKRFNGSIEIHFIV